MNVCTAVGAIGSKKNHTITFKSEAHKIFYLNICRSAGIRMCTIKRWYIVWELMQTQEIM